MRRRVDDDAIISWWEDFDAGQPLGAIAERWEVPVLQVFEALDELGVLFGEDAALNTKIIARVLAGHASPEEDAIMRALGALRGSIVDRDCPPFQPTPWVRVTIHGPRRVHDPMSARERQMNRMASATWRRVVRGDLRRAGLVP